MVNSTINKNSHPKCFQCGSKLILVSQQTIQSEGIRYPQTNTIYRCSNDECQERKNKEQAARLKLKEVQLITQEARRERIQKNKELNQKLSKD
mgnify:CR=1 FL=1